MLFPQNLTVEQPYARANIDQENPIGKNQELAQQDEGECDINGITAQTKNAGRYKVVGMLGIDANTKTPPEGDQAP
jgi:hypothetical protein